MLVSIKFPFFPFFNEVLILKENDVHDDVPDACYLKGVLIFNTLPFEINYTSTEISLAINNSIIFRYSIYYSLLFWIRNV